MLMPIAHLSADQYKHVKKYKAPACAISLADTFGGAVMAHPVSIVGLLSGRDADASQNRRTGHIPFRIAILFIMLECPLARVTISAKLSLVGRDSRR